MATKGFSPKFAAMLRAAGIDFSKSAPAAKQPWVWGQSFEHNKNAPYWEAKNAGVELFGHLTDPTNIKRIEATRKQGVLTPEVQKLYNSLVTMREVEQRRGAESQERGRSWWEKGLDYISRPGRAVTTGLYRGDQAAPARDLGSIDNWLGGFARGAKEGFTGGKDAKTGSDILKDRLGVENRAALFAGGLATDIAVDPLSYVGLGVASRAVHGSTKGVSKIAQGRKIDQTRRGAEGIVASIGANVPKTVKVTPNADALAKALGIDVAAGSKVLTPTQKAAAAKSGVKTADQYAAAVGAVAAKSAQLQLATDLTKVGYSASNAQKVAKVFMNPKLAADPTIA
ncbi:MAG: hypothetical protein ACRC47_03590, partial [Shewanella sp.]